MIPPTSGRMTFSSSRPRTPSPRLSPNGRALIELARCRPLALCSIAQRSLVWIGHIRTSQGAKVVADKTEDGLSKTGEVMTDGPDRDRASTRASSTRRC